MKFYVTFSGDTVPGNKHYAIIHASCEDYLVKLLKARNINNWSCIYRTPNVINRLKLEEYTDVFKIRK